MRNDHVLELADCTEFRLALQARPPGIVHGTLIALVALLATVLLWSAATQAHLVVRGPGRIRPVTTPVKVFNAARGEVFSASSGGRVIAVGFREGDRVLRGAVLIRLETARLDNEIAKQRRTIRAGEEELVKLCRLEEALARQFEVTRAKAAAELAQAREDVRRAERERNSEIRLAELTLRAAEDEEAPLRRLMQRLAVAPSELRTAAAKTREAREKLVRARLPVDEGRVQVALRVRELVERDYVVRREEAELKRETKRAEVEAARTELANLELEHEQAVIRAPIEGVVTMGDVKVGDLLKPGESVAEIAQQQGFRFEVSVPSEDVGHLRVGMPARIKLDAYDYQRVRHAGGDGVFPLAGLRGGGEGDGLHGEDRDAAG